MASKKRSISRLSSHNRYKGTLEPSPSKTVNRKTYLLPVMVNPHHFRRHSKVNNSLCNPVPAGAICRRTRLDLIPALPTTPHSQTGHLDLWGIPYLLDSPDSTFLYKK